MHTDPELGALNVYRYFTDQHIWPRGFDLRCVLSPGTDARTDLSRQAEVEDGGWPVTVTAMAATDKISATLTIGSNHLYATTAGFHDVGYFVGHLATIDLTNGQVTVFNAECSDIRALIEAQVDSANYCPQFWAGLFGRGEGEVQPTTHDVYIATGNGTWDGKRFWGDSILRLDPSGTTLLDSYTPTNQAELNKKDLDLYRAGISASG